MIQLYPFTLRVLTLLCLLPFAKAQAQTITTFAGSATSGFCGDNAAAASACLDDPADVAIDFNGNLYIADASNHRVRKVSTGGTITTIAGTGVASYTGNGGPATSAALNNPTGVAVDFFGNVYIADAGNHVIRKINTSGTISTVAGNNTAGFSGDGGNATLAQLNNPTGIAVDFSGTLYIADAQNHRVRKVDFLSLISTIAGTGTAGYSGNGGLATAGTLNQPAGVAVDGNGNVFIADKLNHAIRKIDITNDYITTVAGTGASGYTGDGGLATAATLNNPFGIEVDAGDNLFIADQLNHVVRKVAPSGIISTFAGNGSFGFSGDNGPATSAMLYNPLGVGVLGGGDVYIADAANNRVRKVTNCAIPNQPAAVLGNLYVCQGAQFTYQVNQLANASAYVWTLPAGWTGSSTTNTITVTAGSNSGTISVYGTNTCGSGQPQTLAVLPLPVPAISPSGTVSFCGAGTLTLSATPSANVTYRWKINNLPITGATNSSHAVLAAGTYLVEVYSGSCTTISAPVVVSAATPPVASITNTGPFGFCNGGSLTLNAATGTGYTYQWLQNGAAISGATSSSYAAAAAGSYAVAVGNNGCNDTSNTASVASYPTPAVTITQSGLTLSTAPGQGSYQWHLNTVPIPGATANTYTVTQNGSYHAAVTNSNSCTGHSNIISITSLAVDDTREGAVRLYPAQGNGNYSLEFPVRPAAPSLTIRDVQGRKVSLSILHRSAGRIVFGIRSPAPGMYILTLVYPGFVYTHKFLLPWP